MKKEWIFTAAIGGCIGALLTMAFGVVVPLGAQKSFEDVSFGHISCTGLLVLPSSDKWDKISLGGYVHLTANQDGATIVVDGGLGAVSTGVISLHAGADSVDSVEVRLSEADKIVRLDTNEHGGRVMVGGSLVTVDGEQVVDTQTSGALLGVGEYGGQLEVYGKGTDHRARAGVGVNKYGHGTLSTWDKNGYSIRR